MRSILLSSLVVVSSVVFLAMANIDDVVPRFVIQLMDDDREFSDEELRGGYTLLSFWSTTCGPCIAQMPYLHEAHEAFGDRLEIVSISRDSDPDVVRAFQRNRYPMPWRHAIVGTDGAIFDAFEVVGTPHLVLIGPNGQIVARTKDLTGERLQRTLVRAGVGGCP